jgi:Reverse transcriptase (RNA-dependent DNA polymerase)
MEMPINLQAIKRDGEEDNFLDTEHVLSVAATADPDTMYWDQAIRQEDAADFIKAAVEEIETHQQQGHWEVIPKEDVPVGTRVLDAIWSMKRKRKLKTNQVYKHKARLNVHGGQQQYGKDYWETFAPVVTWASIRLLLVLTLMYGWYTTQIDFVLAYPQADIECELYMKIPKDFSINQHDRSTHVLKLLKNIYGQRQAGRVWNQHLHTQLIKIGWTQSNADECVYYKDNVVFLVYVDDGILISPVHENIQQAIKKLQSTFKISIEGTLNDYVGISVERTAKDEYHLSQPNIINSILKELNFNEDTKAAKTPAHSTTILGPGAGKENTRQTGPIEE